MSATREPTDETHFGYRTVRRERKAGMVRDVFDGVAEQYDLMNDLMSGGLHRLWKRALVDWLRPRAPMTVLDLAGGTGDVTRRILARLEGDPESRVIACDINLSMLEVGRDRAIDDGHLAGIEWLCGDAERLPLDERSVDAVTVAFGLRNVTDLDTALAEAHRVLRPGGRFICLEFSRVVIPLMDRLYDQYSFRLLPAIGDLVTGRADAYRYLVESIRQFPAQDDFAARIEDAGLGNVRYRNLSGGIVALHSAWRL
jgi:demethylmenaquinone methyltransferase/2-methoxy-6-polyprenyl-1,4-benzoquinol methylase